MKLGKKILECRKKNGLSQEQLSEKIDVTRQTISNWELGETQPNPEQLKKLSKELRISIDELLDNDIKNILIEKTSNTEKVAKSTFKYLKLFILFIILIALIILSLYSLKIISKSRDKGKLIDQTIICNIYGEDHNYNIKYYDLTNEPIEVGVDSYFIDVLGLEKYNDATQIFNIINDYVKKNNGSCVMAYNKDLSDLIDISIKEGTLTNTGMTIIITDNNPNRVIYGGSFYIEKYENNNWNSIKMLEGNHAFNSMAYSVDENRKLEMSQNWELMYGKLEKGIYRIVKNVTFESDTPNVSENQYIIWQEFEIK